MVNLLIIITMHIAFIFERILKPIKAKCLSGILNKAYHYEGITNIDEP